MADQSHEEFELMELLSAAWNYRLDIPSRERLEELLSRDDFAAVRLLTDFTRLHLDLEWIVSSRDAQHKALRAVAKLKAEQSTRSLKRRSLTKPLIAVAAGLILALFGYWFSISWQEDGLGTLAGGEELRRSMVRPPLPVGRMGSQDDIVWAKGEQFQVGQTLLEGQVIEIVEGVGQISMEFGADLILQSPCRVTLISDDLVMLESGKMGVRAAPWGVGFKVKTDDLLVTDLGTQFVVTADGSGSEVQVLEGLVNATSLKHPVNELIIRAAQAARVDANGILETTMFRHDNLIEKLTQVHPLHPIKLSNTGVGLKTGDKDPGWMIVAGNSEFGPFPQPAIVCVPDEKYGENDPAHSQWISVRNGTTDGVPAGTSFKFATTFNLAGIDSRSVRLTALLRADNGVKEVWLNGKRLPIAPWGDWWIGATFYDFHKIEITDGFVPGRNVLAIVVYNKTEIFSENGNQHEKKTPNPMSLRVEWAASGRSQK